MSGIMATIAGNAQNIIYGNGLFNNVTGVNLSPITGSEIIFSGSTSVDQTWIGYFTPASTTTVALSLQTSAFENDFNDNAFTQGQLWLGATAISGFTDGNANITAFNNQTASTNFAMTQDVYYPVRIRWIGSYSRGGFGGGAGGSITFLASSSSAVSGRIFYNTFTNGF